MPSSIVQITVKFFRKNADTTLKYNYILFQKARINLKKELAVILAAVVLLFTGCLGMDPPEITEEQEKQMAQYAAGVLMKHNKFYMENLMTPTPTPEVTPTPSPAPSPTSTPSPTPGKDPTTGPDPSGGPTPTKAGDGGNEKALAELKDVIGVDGLELSYGGYEMYESYTFDSYSVEPSDAGKLLMIAKIIVKNTGDSALNVNLTDKKLNYRLYMDANNYLLPKWSILLNDFTTLNMTLEAGQSFESVLVFEVERDLNPSKLNLFILQGDKTVIVVLK